MDTRKVAAEYRMQQWAQMLQARQESGQSIQNFCESAGISRNTFFYWQRKLRAAACAELAKQGAEEGKELAPTIWARAVQPEPSSAEEIITIEVGGCRVSASAQTDMELLQKVCRMLKAL